MQINLNTDSPIEARAGLNEHVDSVVEAAIQRFSEHITRVEVHLSENKNQKSGDGEHRCMMEARVTGYQPIAVSDHAATLHQAISGAADKLKRAVESALGRLHDTKHRDTAKISAAIGAESDDDAAE